MDPVLRGLAIYFALLLIVRISGKRTLAQMNAFDLVLLLIVSEATQQGMLGDDFSVTNAILVVATLVGADIAMSLFKEKFDWFGKVVDGAPVVLFKDGAPIEHRMKRARVDEADILAAGRTSQAVERLDQIKYAVLEADGNISIIPRRQDA